MFNHGGTTGGFTLVIWVDPGAQGSNRRAARTAGKSTPATIRPAPAPPSALMRTLAPVRRHSTAKPRTTASRTAGCSERPPQIDCSLAAGSMPSHSKWCSVGWRAARAATELRADRSVLAGQRSNGARATTSAAESGTAWRSRGRLGGDDFRRRGRAAETARVKVSCHHPYRCANNASLLAATSGDTVATTRAGSGAACTNPWVVSHAIAIPLPRSIVVTLGGMSNRRRLFSTARARTCELRTAQPGKPDDAAQSLVGRFLRFASGDPAACQLRQPDSDHSLRAGCARSSAPAVRCGFHGRTEPDTGIRIASATIATLASAPARSPAGVSSTRCETPSGRALPATSPTSRRWPVLHWGDVFPARHVSTAGDQDHQRHWQAATREMRGDIGRQRALPQPPFRLS